MKRNTCSRSIGLAGISLMMAGMTIPTMALDPVDLGSAAEFAVLAGSTVTNTGETNVHGDLGVSPGTAVTGFPPGILHGDEYVADGVAEQAQEDLTTAYDDAGDRGEPQETLDGDVGGWELGPGLYYSPSSLAVSSGTLTLDGQGDCNSVFIFEIESTFNVDSEIILINEAQATNIFWRVGSSATLGTNSVTYGTVMALTSITMATGATLYGRALARNGAVTMDDNLVQIPMSCAALRVDLASFTATAAGIGSPVTLDWETAAEFDNAGFNLYRAADGARGQKLNSFPIAAEGSETQGASYRFVDTAPMTEGEVRGYYLEDVEFGGKRTLHGPVRVGPFTGARSSVDSWALYN